MDPKILHEKRFKLIEEMETITNKALDDERSFTEEEEKRLDDLNKEIEALAKTIERVEAAAKLAEERTRPVGSPVDIRVTREDGEDEKGNCRVWNSFGEQMQAVIRCERDPRGSDTKELREKIDKTNKIMRAATGMNESIGADGGVLVQKDFANEIVDKAYLEAPFASQVQRLSLSTGANGIKIPYVDETSRVDGSRQGGIQMYWEEEAATISPTKGKFGLMELNTKKLVGAAYLTEELIQDASVLGTWVTGAFQRELAFKLDDSFINGNGAGKPLGILNSGALVTQLKDGSQTGGTITATNLSNMFSRLFKRNRGSAIWLYNQDCEGQLMALALTIGSNSYPVMILGGVTGNVREEIPVDRILGRAAYASEHCATKGTIGDIIFTDPKAYIAIDKGGAKQAVSVHVRFLQDEQVLKFTYRVDGMPSWRAALTPYKSTITLSPYVVVETRT